MVNSINHNLSSLNLLRQAERTNNRIDGVLKRMTSGLRINSAADDPAGLAVSEKMRARIMGLEQARRNAEDGISLLQTVDGSLSTVHQMLHRMRVLSIQAANDTLTEVDRGYIQQEIDEIGTEIDRIREYTEFNTIKPLKYGRIRLLENIENLDTEVNFSVARGRVENFNISDINRTFTRGDLESYLRGNTYESSVGLAETFNGVSLSSFGDTNTYNTQQETYAGVNDTSLGWADNNNIVFVSDRDAQNYIAASDGSDDPTVTAAGFSADTTNSSTGDELYQNGADLWIRSADNSVDKLFVAGASDASWSPDGTKVLYTRTTNSNQNVFVADYDPVAMTAGAAAEINDDNDQQNISTEFVLANQPEVYGLGGANPSIRVFKNGSDELLAGDPNGFTYNAGPNSITLNGNGELDANDYLSVQYITSIDGDAFDGSTGRLIPNPPEIYNLGGGGPSSVFVTNSARGLVPYDPVNGWTLESYGGSDRMVAMHGSWAPMAGESVTVSSVHDYTAGSTDQDGSIEIALTGRPEIYNVDPSLPNWDPAATKKSIRVFNINGATEINYASNPGAPADGFTFEPGTGANGTIILHGDDRPQGGQQIRVVFATDSNPAPYGEQDGVNHFEMSEVPQPLADTKTVSIWEGGAWVQILENSGPYQDPGFDPNKYFSIDYANNILSLHGDARLDPANTQIPRVRISYTSSDDNRHNVGGVIADYSEVFGMSERVWQDSGGGYVPVQQSQGGPDGYRVDGAGDVIEFQGADRVTLATTVKAEFIIDDPGDPYDGNVFRLPSDAADYGGLNGSERVTFTGELESGIYNNALLQRGLHYQISGDEIELLPGHRMVGNNGAAVGDSGHELSIEYLPDDPANPADGNDFILPQNPLIYGGGIGTEELRLTGDTIGGVVNNQLLTRDVDYTIAGDTVSLIGNSRLVGDNGGAGHELSVRFLPTNVNDLSLIDTPLQYEPSLDGSEEIRLTGNTIGGAVNDQLLVQNVDYTISGNQLELLGDMRLNGGGPYSVEARYQYGDANLFYLEPPIPEDSIVKNTNYSNMTLTVRDENGATVNTIPVTDSVGDFIDPRVLFIQSDVTNPFIQLTDDLRLVGGPYDVEINYDFGLEYQKIIKDPYQFTLQIGANQGQTFSGQINEMTREALGIEGISVMDHESAENAITSVDEAIDWVSGERSRIGAMINTLERRVNDLEIERENQQAAESRIRDNDMALDMTSLVTEQIRMQVSIAMMSQANSMPAMLLKLLPN